MRLIDLRRNSLVHRCPKDAFVAEILAADGATIVKGQPLLRFKDEDERIALERLAAASEIAQTSGRMLDPTYVDLQRRMVSTNLAIAQQYQVYAAARSEFTSLSEKLGLNSPNKLALDQSGAALRKTEGELEKATAALSLFEANLNMAIRRQEVLVAQIEKETEYVRGKQKALTIVALQAGNLTFSVVEGSFCKSGDVVATVN